MPIFFALYRVFYNIPAYIVNVKEHFMGLVEEIKQTEGFVDKLTQMMADYKLNATLRVDLSTTGDTLNNYIVDNLYKIPSARWEKMGGVDSYDYLKLMELQGKYDENLRITFDFNLRSRDDNLRLEFGDTGDNYFENDAK